MLRLYSGKIPDIVDDVYETLVEAGDIEAADEEEVKRDIESVLEEYIRMDNELTEMARDRVAETGGPLGQKKAELAEQKGFGIGEDSVGYIIEQLIETFFHSNFVEEIFATDRAIRKKLAPVLREHMQVEEELDEEVRDKIKNLEEGTQEWDIEYSKLKEKLKRTKNLED